MIHKKLESVNSMYREYSMSIGNEKAANDSALSIKNVDNSLTILTSHQADSFIYAFHTNTLPLTQKLKFILNLVLCRECRHYVRSYKNTIRLTQDGFRTANPIEKLPEKLIQIIARVC